MGQSTPTVYVDWPHSGCTGSQPAQRLCGSKIRDSVAYDVQKDFTLMRIVSRTREEYRADVGRISVIDESFDLLL